MERVEEVSSESAMAVDMEMAKEDTNTNNMVVAARKFFGFAFIIVL